MEAPLFAWATNYVIDMLAMGVPQDGADESDESDRSVGKVGSSAPTAPTAPSDVPDVSDVSDYLTIPPRPRAARFELKAVRSVESSLSYFCLVAASCVFSSA